MMPTSLAAAVVPRTNKFTSKNGLHVFKRGESFLQNGILHFVFNLSSIIRNRTTKIEFTQMKN